ncbi:MFS transporter [Cupriavidus basilensis]|uniref:MFS transporter n=1 Tax=Cupriavidus basilensis TaxID=68895 RepID=A0ABT6AQR9_9BURK|nr:MFS transporter [Cupriavidus basilensis]MDF3834959.1 MFS transporter [Cupriavidus basilensis]
MTTRAECTLRAQTAPVGGTNWMTLLLATACGLIVANLYYAQPLIGPIGHALGLSPQAAGLIVTLIQAGYGLGLLLIVPLGDVIENRRLICTLLAASALALAAAALAGQAGVFLMAAACIGLSSVAAQVLVPFAAHLAPEHARGRVVGNVMSGLMLGIMLARPVASLVTDLWGWHAIFAGSAAGMALLSAVLARLLPERRPSPAVRYRALLASMWQLLGAQPVLRRRAAYQACMFGAFSLFWTTVPLWLAGPGFGLSQKGIALFALAGVAGAVAAPIAGRVADRGHGRRMTALAMLLAAGSFLLGLVGTPGTPLALAALTLAAIVLDFGVAANLVVGQRAIFALGAQYRSRLNGLFMAVFFTGGAIASAVGAWAFAQGGWRLTSAIGLGLPVLAGLYFATERGPAGAPRH